MLDMSLKVKVIEMDKYVRISPDEYYMELAKTVALRSTCLRVKHGAVIVKDDIVVSTGYNGAPRCKQSCLEVGSCWRKINNIEHGQHYDQCLAVHAEANAIIFGGRANTIGGTIYIGGWNVSDEYYEKGGLFVPTMKDLRVDVKPCIMCSKLIVNSGICRVMVYRRSEESGEIYVKKIQVD